MNNMERIQGQYAIGRHRARLMPVLLLCLLAMAGCSRNELITGQPDNDGNVTGQKITITASMPEPGAATRLAYEDQTNDEGTGKLEMKWKESGEKIYLLNFERNTSSILEQIVNTRSEDGKKTDFTGDLPSNTAEGDILYAYYNSSLQSFDIINATSNLFPIGDITSDGSLDKMIHPMYAKITHQSGATANFSFKYLTAALKLTFSGLPSGVTLTPLILSGSGEFGVCGSAYADLTKGIPTYSNGKAMGKIDNPILTSPGNAFYTAFIPADLTSGMTITAKGSDNKVYRADLPSINIEAGNIYTATAALTELSISGDIDMTNMPPEEVKTAINTALALGFTEITLKGELSKTGIGDTGGTFVGNAQITKCDLTGVAGWVDATLPDRAFMRCSALQEVVLPDDVQVIETYAFAFCPALATVNLAQVTRIDESAFRESTSLTELSLDNVEAIALHAFYGCTGLQTLRMPKCTRFGSYIVTGCKALTRIEATAAGDFVDIDNNSDIENNAVFHNRGGSIGHTGDKAFNPETCDLVLNVDKKEGGTGHPTATTGSDFTWTTVNALPMKWQSITFQS